MHLIHINQIWFQVALLIVTNVSDPHLSCEWQFNFICWKIFPPHFGIACFQTAVTEWIWLWTDISRSWNTFFVTRFTNLHISVKYESHCLDHNIFYWTYTSILTATDNHHKKKWKHLTNCVFYCLIWFPFLLPEVLSFCSWHKAE